MCEVIGALAALGVNCGGKIQGKESGSEQPGKSRIGAMHDRLLQAFGSASDELLILPEDWLTLPPVQEFQGTLREFLLGDFQQNSIWASGDPRTGRLLPAWMPVLADLHITPTYLHLIDDPLDAAEWIGRPGQLSHEKALLVWLDHHLTAERDSRTSNRIFLPYSQFCLDWRASLEPLGHLLGIEWPLPDGNYTPVAIQPAAPLPIRIPELVTMTHDALVHAAGGVDQAGSQLDSIGAQWESAKHLLGPALDTSALRKQAAELEADYKLQAGASRDFLERLRTTQEKLRAKQADVKKQKEKLEQAKHTIKEMESSLSWRITSPLRRALHKREPKKNPSNPPLPARPEPAQVDPSSLRFAAVANPDVSVIIPVYNQLRYTVASLASLQACRDPLTLEVIVIDDGSSDDSQRVLSSIPGIRYYRNEANTGFVGSCNRGAQLATGTYILFLNNDTRVGDGTLGAMVETFQYHPNAGLVGAKLIYPDGRLQEAGGAVFSDASAANLGHGQDPDHPDYSYLRDVDYCSGACIMLPRTFFLELGSFDPIYTPCYYEDTDLAFKVRQAGRRVLYQPLARVEHYEGATSGTDLSTGPKSYQERNRYIFFEKWAKQLALHRAGPGAPSPGDSRRILSIENQVPRASRSSGALRISTILRLLVEAGHSVTLLPDDLVAPPGDARDLQQGGIRVLSKPHFADSKTYLQAHATEFDVVILGGYNIARRHLETIRAASPATRIIFDTVDLHYLRETGQAKLLGDDALRRHAQQTRVEEVSLVSKADLTWVVSPIEQAALKREAPAAKVEIVSNLLDVHASATPFAMRRDLLFIGGFSHAPNLDAVTFFVREVWPAVLSGIPDAKFHIIGDAPPPEIQALASESIIVTGYLPDVKPAFDGIKLSVAPLRFGAGVKGKINQSMSYGVPVVATPVAVEGMQLTPEENVLVADTSAQFAARIIELYHSEVLWNRLSANGLQVTRDLYSIESMRKKLPRML